MGGVLVNPYKITIFNRNKDYEVSSFKTSVFSESFLCIGGILYEEKDNYYNIYNGNRNNYYYAL